MNKEAIEILEEILQKVQEMRENGDTDLRTIIYFLREAIKDLQTA